MMTSPSHLALDLLSQGLQLVHLELLLGPADDEALLLVWLGDLNTGLVMFLSSVVVLPHGLGGIF